MFRMVIISHLGELTNDTRIAGDSIRYRIYFDRPTASKGKIVIVDELDKNLSHVVVSNGGHYDPGKHAITWVVQGSLPKKGAHVEFQARVKSAQLIHNNAVLRIAGARRRKSNTVTTTVIAPPRLGWIPFRANGQLGEPPPFPYMKDETTTGLTVNFDLPGMYVHEVKVDGVTYHQLSIPGMATLLDVGKPQLPIMGQLVEVPYGVDFKPVIVKSESVALDGYNVYPAQKPIDRRARSRARPFAIDPPTYLGRDRYPGELAVIRAEDVGIIRGHRVVFLKVNPLQYDPLTRRLHAFSNIEVQLEYSHPAQVEGVDPRIQSKGFEDMLQRSVLNYKGPERFGREEPDPEVNGCHYLILTHPDFYKASDANSPVVRLQNWKRRKGLLTRVVDVTQIGGGNTAAAIRAFIQNAYDTWNPAPTYVLLVGDVDCIPRNDGVLHDRHRDAAGNDTPIGTDLTYAEVDGSDYFPDIFIGRLPVQTLAQAGDVVDKILKYEQQPPATPAHADYYTNTSLVGLFEDVDGPGHRSDGREDGSFRIIEFQEAIRTYLNSQNYQATRIYSRSGTWPQGPQTYENGTALPVELTLNGNPAAGIPGFPWNGGTADIRAAFNSGNFLITYNGHGAPTRWGRPAFSTTDFAGLTNVDLNPVVFSFTCMTGWFDNEDRPNQVDTNPDTGGVQGLGVADESFCELLLRRPNTGAVAVIGASRISWEPNDFMMLGAYKAIWPDFNPNPPTSVPLPQMQMGPLTRMGQLLNFSKFYMANAYNFLREPTFEMYHLLGDPEMPMWTRAPAKLAVDYPQGIGATGEQDFVVKVMDDATRNPVQSATVTLTRPSAGGNPVDRIVKSLLTDPSGRARFSLDGVGAGDLDITVTALNFLPFQGVVKVAAGGAILNRLDPSNGPENQIIHVGGQNFSGSENVDIYFDGHQVKTVAAVSGSFGQPGADVDIQVPSSYPLGPVNVMAVGQTSGRYAVDVFQVRSTNPIDLWTYSQWDPTTWVLNPSSDNPTWNNPEIQLYEGATPVDSNNLVVGHTYTVKLNVHNDTAFAADQTKVVFRWANFGMGGPWYDFRTATLRVPPGGKVAEVPFTPPQTGHVCVLGEIYHLEDITPKNNQGQENLHVGVTTSPTKVCFPVWNMTKQPAAVFLEVRQLVPPLQKGKVRLWSTRVSHPNPQVLEPGARGEACIVVDPDVADATEGTQAQFAVTGFINGTMIGGVNLVMTKK